MRIRPYVTLADPGEAKVMASAQPVLGAVAPLPQDPQGTGASVPPEQEQPPEAGETAPRDDDTLRLRAIPEQAPRAGEPTARPSGAGCRSKKPTGRTSRRLVPPVVVAVAVAVITVGGTAMALLAPDSSGDDVMLSEIKPSAPVVRTAAPVPFPTRSAKASGASPSVSATPSSSPSGSPTASASPSASSPPASPTAPPNPSRSTDGPPAHQPPAPQAPSLTYGDSGPAVTKLQRLLAKRGLYKGRINGRFGGALRHAVSQYQSIRGIDDDKRGTYGPATRRALEG